MKAVDFFAQIAPESQISRLHPLIIHEFKKYLQHEKAIRFGDKFVINTHFPPFPSPAFTRFIESISLYGAAEASHRLYSVTWAVTNRCNYRCWHCYNAGRDQIELPTERMIAIAGELQDFGAAVVTLTGGEPLLRRDLEDIASSFDDRTSLVLGTTGENLSPRRAELLKKAGIFAVGISLDSVDRDEHDRLRGCRGAFQTALNALKICADTGLYPYIVSVATREFLERTRFMAFLEFAGRIGALEVHLLEPTPTGRLASRPDVALTPVERSQIIAYQKEVALREDLPVLSSFAYLESEDHFGCGAGLTHLYIDGSGQVCPCNLVPMSFGDLRSEPLETALDRLRPHFSKPRTGCIGRVLAGKIPSPQPSPPELSETLSRRYLSGSGEEPGFFAVLKKARELNATGTEDVAAAYERIYNDYDEFWLCEAGKPVRELISRIPWKSDLRLLEAGCGTGFATAILAERLSDNGSIVAVDISEGMISQARCRVGGAPSVEFIHGDALEVLKSSGTFDAVFSSWVLGYIRLKPFFSTVSEALVPNGILAFIVHKQNSPKIPLEIFKELVMEDPSVLMRNVDFDFPENTAHVRKDLEAAGMDVVELGEGHIRFIYPDPQGVQDHLLKSGAGTAYYDAIDPIRRPVLEAGFLERLASQAKCDGGFEVIHDYVWCIAQKPQAGI
jgi:MoaA/NifB/PqqE/SkfB family radical SAM enzyme/SAM-dependent methyltransferase